MQRMKRFTRGKRRTLVIVPIAVLAIIAVLTLIAFLRVLSTRSLVANAHQVLEATDRVMTDLADAETGQRGYLLTGRSAYLRPYRAAVRALARDTVDLRLLTLDRPAQHLRLTVLFPLVDRKLAELASTIALRQQNGQARAVAVVETDSSRLMMEESRRLLVDLERDENEALARHVATETARLRLLLVVFGAGLGLLAASILISNALLGGYATAQSRALDHIADQNEELAAQRDTLEQSAAEMEVLNEELLERTQLAEDARAAAEAEHRRVVGLHDFTVALSATATPEDVARVAGEWGPRVMAASAAVVATLSDDGRHLEPVHVAGLAMPGGPWSAIPIGAATLVADAVRRGEVVHAGSAEVRAAAHAEPPPRSDLEAALAAPLRFEERTLGGWVLYFDEPRAFNADELRLFEALTEQCAQALERTRLFVSERDAREQAEEANAAKVKFLRVMSHDLRTPLNAILGYAEILHDGYVGPLEGQQQEFLGRILASTGVLRALIEEVLEYARIEAGRLEIHAVDLSVEPLLKQVESLVAPQAVAKGIAITREAAPPLKVRGDADRIGQILSNLVTNAIKYTPTGGAVSVDASADNGGVTIRVADTGPGIEEGDLDRIFEPFVQLDHPDRAPDGEGVGLGLAISRELARAMGGELRAESQPGRGTTFKLHLPLADPGNLPRNLTDALPV
jgi:signal transduction histidine kinase/CHASE3 domain sensor protein